MAIDKWDRRMLDQAAFISTWSKDPSTKVGAVIAKDRRIISQGFNGFPQKIKDLPERLNNREVKYEMVIHAELNALIFARFAVTGATLYTWPLPPCSRCAVIFIQAGLARVVAPPPDERWAENWLLSSSLFGEAGVEVEIVEDARTVAPSATPRNPR